MYLCKKQRYKDFQQKNLDDVKNINSKLNNRKSDVNKSSKHDHRSSAL